MLKPKKMQCMNRNTQHHLSAIIWMVTLIAIGGGIGSFTKSEISTWYSTLHRSPLTPPNDLFPVAWTILYGIIGACGWLIWRPQSLPKLSVIKILYVTQLILNWSWTPLFFHYHLTGLSMIVLSSMDILVGILIVLTYPKMRTVSLLMLPYLLWILFASYLNCYIWQHHYR